LAVIKNLEPQRRQGRKETKFRWKIKDGKLKWPMAKSNLIPCTLHPIPYTQRGEFMCDTFIAMPSSTGDGAILFGKNSDREPNEAQALE
jgi:hypothetical protein